MGQTFSNIDIDFTEEDRHLIRKSYTALRGKTAEFSAMFFANVFVASPQFAHRFSDQFDKHVEKFISEISLMVNCLAKDMRRLKSILDKNADVHEPLEVTFDEYEVLRNAFLQTLRMTLRQALTKEMEEAWNKGLTMAFTYIWNRISEIKKRKLELINV